MNIIEAKNLISPQKQVNKQFYLDLLDEEKQRQYENCHINAVLTMLRAVYINKLKASIKAANSRIEEIMQEGEYNSAQYIEVSALKREIEVTKSKINSYKCFFDEPYFARMDLYDEKEGYNSYYIGKKGDVRLEIVDWRAPLARKYYQKSQLAFTINDYNYKLILRRAIKAKHGAVEEFKNEYLSLRDYLTKEEINGRDEEIIFDPFLKDILLSRKEKSEVSDIIETIQERQYEIITLPEDREFGVQGVAGSGKTMIMLHRLSYLMYNNESIKPSDVMLITPSEEFNAFIDELSAILELERVKTSTLENYFLSVLERQDIHLADKIDYSLQLPPEYVAYIYSENFICDIEKKLDKIFDGVEGMFTSEEVLPIIKSIIESCNVQLEYYKEIKNVGLRVRRAVLGEIKEKPEGGFYYTKQSRELFNCVEDVRDFLSLDMSSVKMSNQSYFYKQLAAFYNSIIFIRRYSAKICSTAVEDLATLRRTVEREIANYRIYKTVVKGVEVLTYADSIEKRQRTLKEIDRVSFCMSSIADLFLKMYDFADVLRASNYMASIGKCVSVKDTANFFYKECVQKVKRRFGIAENVLCRTDAYVACLLLSLLGFNLSPKFAFVFIDEGQDISLPEYNLLRAINNNAKFNVFGDLKQNITEQRGLTDWQKLQLPVYTLNRNYRNTNKIVELVSSQLAIEMQSVGLDGQPVEYISDADIRSFFKNKSGLKAIIATEQNIDKYNKKSYNRVSLSGEISKTKINVMTVYESKGLEFTAVAVDDGGMTLNEKYIAYTRALSNLAIIVEK